MASGRVEMSTPVAYPILSNLVVRIPNRVLSAGATISIPADSTGAHYIYIVTYGTWNHSQLLAVFPANGSVVVRPIAMYASASDSIEITANGSWGINIKNTGSVAHNIQVFVFTKGN